MPAERAGGVALERPPNPPGSFSVLVSHMPSPPLTLRTVTMRVPSTAVGSLAGDPQFGGRR